MTANTAHQVRGERERDSAAAPVRLSAVVEDIGERERADAALARLAEQRRLALDAAQMGWWHYDLSTGDVICDERARAIFGISGDRTGYHDVIALMHPDDRSTVDAAVNASINPVDPKPYAIEYRVIHADGAVRWVQARGQAYFEGDGGDRRAVNVVGTVADITDTKAAQDALRQSEAQLRQLADAMPQIVWAAQPSGHVDYYNQQWHAYTGASPEMAGNDWAGILHPDDLDRVNEVWSASIRSGTPYELEFRLRRASDGMYRWFLGRALPVRDAGGAIVRWFGTDTDIHDKKMAEEAVRRSREQMELVVKGANIGVWYCPLPFDRLIWDEKVKEHFHLPPDAEVTIETFYERIHPADRERTRATIEKSIGERQPYDVDYRTVSADRQHTRWIRAMGRAFYGAHGEPVRFDGITVDVTDRVNAELALRQSEQLLRAVVEATPECVKLVSPEGSLLYMNPAGLVMIEADAMASVQGACVFNLIVPEHRPEWQERHARICAGEKLSWQFEIVGLNGTRRWMETHAVPLLLPDGRTGQLAVTREISARKRAEAEREQLLESERAARSEAERASRLKDEFLATVSHELRTPLNAILGYSQLMRHGVMKADEIDQGLEVIQRNARVQTQIIEDILDMSRIVTGKLRLDVQRVDVPAVIDAALETVRPAADAKGIRLISTVDPLAGPVSGDPNRLQQVVWNLLNNAIKFTPKGGRVQIVLERVNSHIELAVSDTGQGIKPEFLPHMFDKFRQADASAARKHGGLGLGLSIVKSLVEMHGGTVRAESPGEGQGATFIISLPVSAVHAGPQAHDRVHPRSSLDGGISGERPSLDSVSVLVVDDEPDARELVRRLLEDCGARVATAASAQEALGVLDRQSVDVLVSDIGMPGEDGYELVRRVRARGPQRQGAIPAAALTAFARSEDRTRALRAGYQTHIAKPVEPMELVFAVASLAGKTGGA